MTDTSKMRSEFEAWHADKHNWLPRHYRFYWNGTSYEGNEDFQDAWECWQASRQAVVIKIDACDGEVSITDIQADAAAQGVRVEVQS